MIIPRTRQPRFARGSLDVMGSVCIALGEVHTRAALPFPALKVPSGWGVSSNPSWCMGHTAWHCPVPHPLGNKPQNLTPSPLQSRLLSKGTGAKGYTGGSRAGDQGHPQTHTRPPHCIFYWALLRKHCHQPDLSVSQSPREASPSPAKLSRPAEYYPNGMTVFLTVTGKEQRGSLAGSSSLPGSHCSHTARLRLVTTVITEYL